MPHIVRFSIFRQQDIDLSLHICKRLGITPEDFARSAFFEAVEGAVQAIRQREEENAAAEKLKAEAEAALGVGEPPAPAGEQSDGITSSGDSAGTAQETLGGEDASTDTLAEASTNADTPAS